MKKRARAIIIKDGMVLTIKRIKPDGIHWVFPGGGVEEGETNEQALVRECKEELGVDVRVGKLFGKDDFEWEGEMEEIFFYECEIVSGQLGSGTGPEYQKDSVYVGSFEVEWLKISELKTIDLRPVKIRDILAS